MPTRAVIGMRGDALCNHAGTAGRGGVTGGCTRDSHRICTTGYNDYGKHARCASVASQHDFGIDGLEFATGVIDCHLPVNAALASIDSGRPSCQLGLERLQLTDPTALQALPR